MARQLTADETEVLEEALISWDAKHDTLYSENPIEVKHLNNIRNDLIDCVEQQKLVINN